MKKSLFLCTLFVLFCVKISAQDEAVRYYEEGPLTFEDFRGIPVKNDSSVTRIVYNIGYTLKRLRRNDSNLTILGTKNFMYPEVSYIRKSYRQQKLLDFNQVIFNLSEIERRRLHVKLLRKEDYNDSEEILNAHYLRAHDAGRQFIEQMEQLLDSLSISYLHMQLDSTQNLIDQIPIEAYPEVEARNFKCSFFLGYGRLIEDETLSKYLSINSGFVFGLDFFYRRFFFTTAVNMLSNKITADFQIGNEPWSRGDKGNINHGNFGLGYLIHEGRKSKIMPFLGFTNYVARNTQGEKELMFEENGWSYGLSYDFKFWKSVNFVKVPYRETTDHYLRLRLTVTDISYKPIEGNLIVLTVGYGYVIGGQKLK